MKNLGLRTTFSNDEQMIIYPIVGIFSDRIALAPCPQGADSLDSEINFLKQNDYRLIVSMLTQEEQEKHKLTEEQKICEAHGIKYLNFPIRDEVADSDEQTLLFVEQVKQHISNLDEKDKILFHCRGGVGRSSMMIALVLANETLNIDEIFAQITQARGENTPESEKQLNWVRKLHKIMIS